MVVLGVHGDPLKTYIMLEGWTRGIWNGFGTNDWWKVSCVCTRFEKTSKDII
jgi:hypothetical protein